MVVCDSEGEDWGRRVKVRLRFEHVSGCEYEGDVDVVADAAARQVISSVACKEDGK